MVNYNPPGNIVGLYQSNVPGILRDGIVQKIVNAVRSIMPLVPLARVPL